MSGTSVDGLDICACQFERINKMWNYSILATYSYNFDDKLKEFLLEISCLSSKRVVEIENQFSLFVSNCILDFMKNKIIRPDIIAIHGHTVLHNPDKGYTYQIGNGEMISKLTGVKVVCDFRRGDVALGGQGAPLVPIGDKLLFGQYSACLNLGGFSNISFDNKNGIRKAYDICPVNILLNKYARKAGKDFDENGNIARSGNIIENLLLELNQLSFYRKKEPKSLAVEWLEENITPILIKYEKCNIADVLCTLTEHIAFIISNEISQHRNVLFTGGGTNNLYLLGLIKNKTEINIVVPDSVIIEFKEAIVFAFLGVLRILGENNVLASVTGAKKDSCCGIISLP